MKNTNWKIPVWDMLGVQMMTPQSDVSFWSPGRWWTLEEMGGVGSTPLDVACQLQHNKERWDFRKNQDHCDKGPLRLLFYIIILLPILNTSGCNFLHCIFVQGIDEKCTQGRKIVTVLCFYPLAWVNMLWCLLWSIPHSTIFKYLISFFFFLHVWIVLK